jgi:hypothetical protein
VLWIVVAHLFHTALQDFSPEPATYDVIWIQWVIGHLRDGVCVCVCACVCEYPSLLIDYWHPSNS